MSTDARPTKSSLVILLNYAVKSCGILLPAVQPAERSAAVAVVGQRRRESGLCCETLLLASPHRSGQGSCVRLMAFVDDASQAARP